MDDPHHRDVRKIGADWFRPSVLKKLKARCDELAKIWVDKMAEKGPELDFMTEIAVNYPLYVILTLLGLPESDFPRMLKLTQEMFGGNDEEFQRGGDVEDMLAVLMDFFNYSALTASRRETPTEDLASAIANAKINGEPLSDMDTLSHYVITASAGHDTTSAGIAGGLRALLEHPDQLARLQNDMSLMGTAVEEMIRWVVPVRSSCTAQEDTEVRGVKIARVRRSTWPTPRATATRTCSPIPTSSTWAATRTSTLSFGYGVHFCLGASLARMEMNSFFSELIPRIKSIELNGKPELMATTFVGGLKGTADSGGLKQAELPASRGR